MVICRAYIGRTLRGSKSGDHLKEVRGGDHDCWIGLRQFREFVFYGERKVLPWWIVSYKRRTLDNRERGEQETFHRRKRIRDAKDKKELNMKRIEEIKENKELRGGRGQLRREAQEEIEKWYEDLEKLMKN